MTRFRSWFGVVMCAVIMTAVCSSVFGAVSTQGASMVMIDGCSIPVVRVEPVAIGDTRNFVDVGKIDAAVSTSTLKSHALGDEFPGVVIYALGRSTPWKSAIKITAPLDADVLFDASGGLNVGPNPGHLVVKKGGTRVIYFDELSGLLANGAADIGVITSAPAISVTSFLAFNSGATHTSFSSNSLLQSIRTANDRFRIGTAINTKTTPLGEIGTDVLAFNYGDESQTIMIVSYDDTGAPVAGIEMPLSPHAIYQQQIIGDIKSGTVQLYRGCNVGPCFVSESPVYFLVTSGPRNGGTVETLKSQNIGSE